MKSSFFIACDISLDWSAILLGLGDVTEIAGAGVEIDLHQRNAVGAHLDVLDHLFAGGWVDSTDGGTAGQDLVLGYGALSFRFAIDEDL